MVFGGHQIAGNEHGGDSLRRFLLCVLGRSRFVSAIKSSRWCLCRKVRTGL